MKHKKRFSSGFTIVELLVVIVVIGVLASVVVVAYNGISQRARDASMQSDLTQAKKQIESFYALNGYYPEANNCTATTDTQVCLKPSGINILTYTPNTSSRPTSYTLNGVSSTVASANCPPNFIAVPGSSTYGTSDFCVMKYEAKADDNGDGIGDTTQNTGFDTWPANTHPISTTRKLVSSPYGYPVVRISQTTAITAANSTNGMVRDCPTGCHLITEAEWMTIAQNVLSNPVNWSGGAVGSGSIYSGHNDDSPAKAIQAGSDTDGYANTGNSAGSNQKRTLTLTNGEVIWDFAGNVWEWTAGQTTGGQPGASTNTGFQWTEWPSVNVTGSLAVNPFPSGTGLPGASSWTSTQGIGQLYSDTANSTLRGFVLGGSWSAGSGAGVFNLALNFTPSNANNYSLGLRVSR
jgi:prepilin-type N-terminal cleavage/methylation domain-containing protein